jgi:D-Tyr-tRNAtyr deacylase
MDLLPALGIIVSVATLVFTAISLLQKADASQLVSLKERVARLEHNLKESEANRFDLIKQVAELTELLVESTARIRADVKEGTRVAQTAADKATAAYDVANTVNEKIELATEAIARGGNTDLVHKLHNEGPLHAG